MELEDEDKFDFDPLDVTKIWPEELFPLQPIGRMVLNKNVDNFFAENEQLAFSPSLVVPGVCLTNSVNAAYLDSIPCAVFTIYVIKVHYVLEFVIIRGIKQVT